MPTAVMDALVCYPWPVNGELQNVIERAFILSSGTSLHVPLGDLPFCGFAGPRTDSRGHFGSPNESTSLAPSEKPDGFTLQKKTKARHLPCRFGPPKWRLCPSSGT